MHNIKGEGYILRLWEQRGAARQVKICFNMPIREAYWCDLVERKLAMLPAVHQSGLGSLQIDTEPFEIHTLYLEMGT